MPPLTNLTVFTAPFAVSRRQPLTNLAPFTAYLTKSRYVPTPA